MSRLFSLAILGIAVAALLQTTAGQTIHVVGDNMGWVVPPGGSLAYGTWAGMHNFTVGDILVFNFVTGQQDVARVTKEAFDTCNSTNPISLKTTGPANFTLDTAGEYYFISTLDRHCPLGQKLNITVTAPGPIPSPAPHPPPSPTPAPPPRGPVTYIVGDELGWLVPPAGKIAYDTWAYNKTFMVGDTLVFNFVTGQQDVARVTKEAFDTCNSTNPISLKTTGPANFTLDTAGEYYFTSTMDRHCSLGQKLEIKVTAPGPTSSPAPAPTTPYHPPSSAPAPAPTRGPMTYIVGDDLGWVVPPGGAIAYETWAHNKTFMIGDTLVFNFINGTQDVAMVTKTAYESCDTNSTIANLTTSPAKIMLNTSGEHFFTSTYPRHCTLGQKLAINVTASSNASPPSGHPTPPSGNTIAPSSPPPTAGGPPPPSSSAPSRIVAGFFITLLSMAMALF